MIFIRRESEALFACFMAETVKMRDLCMAEVKEEEELEEYNLYMNWFKEVAGDFGSWFSHMAEDISDKKVCRTYTLLCFCMKP